MLKPEFAHWKPILTKGIEKCANDANNDTYKTMEGAKKRNGTHDGREKCSKRSGYFLACVGGQMFQNCPSDLWKNTTKCGDFKGVVQKCNAYFPPPPHHQHHHQHNDHHHHGQPPPKEDNYGETLNDISVKKN